MRIGSLLCALFLLLPNLAMSKELVVLSSVKNGIKSITIEELIQLYLGRTTSVGDKTLSPTDYDDDTQLSQYFREKLLKKNAFQYRQYWARVYSKGQARPPASDAKDEVTMIEILQQQTNAIGYVYDLTKVPSDLKVLLVVKL